MATDWNPSWAWGAASMISTLGDLRTWTDALASGTLLTPQTQQQRLQTVNIPGQPPSDGYGLGLFNLAGWVGHNGNVPGYQTVAVHLADKQMTMVIMINTNIGTIIPGVEYQSSNADKLATAITAIATPDHVYAFDG